MVPFGRSRRDRERDPARPRNAAGRDDRRSSRTEDLYRTDLDRHLWSLRSERPPRERRRRWARWVASLAGTLGAAGLSYWAYRRLRRTDDAGAEVGARGPVESELEGWDLD